MIGKLKELLEKATPVPWAWEATGEKSNDWCVGTAMNPDTGEYATELIEQGDGFEPVDLVCSRDDATGFQDARLIVEVVNALPKLLEAVDALKELVDASEELVDSFRLAKADSRARAILAKLEGVE